jgi:hypothetical protein
MCIHVSLASAATAALVLLAGCSLSINSIGTTHAHTTPRRLFTLQLLLSASCCHLLLLQCAALAAALQPDQARV